MRKLQDRNIRYITRALTVERHQKFWLYKITPEFQTALQDIKKGVNHYKVNQVLVEDIFSDNLKLFSKFDHSLLSNYLSPERIANLHPETFVETSNEIIRFLNDCYLKNVGETKERIARVVNSTMGGGKSTSLEVIAKLILKKPDMPILLVFNKEKSMTSVLKPVIKYAKDNGIENAVKLVNSTNIKDAKDDLHKYKIVGINQQRLRDIAINFGNFSIFCTYKTIGTGWDQYVKRPIIFDEMPIFFNAEVFDVGTENNCIDWFDEGSNFLDTKNVPKKDIQKARLILTHLFQLELAEVADDDCTSLPTRKLERHIEGSYQLQILKSVLKHYNNIQLSPKSRRRFEWFNKLLLKDMIGVIDRDDKKSSVLCSEFIDYKKFGDILILDGTSDITSSVYQFGKYELLRLKNHHDYNRLNIYSININTSKESRRKDETHEYISDSFLEFKESGLKKERKILALPSKKDIMTYRNSGVISEDEYYKYFYQSDENESTAISILNVTGDNDLSNYDGIALLSLPLRHPAYYKLAAIAIHGTNIDISLCQGKTKKTSITWFNNKEVQKIFESLVLMDFSQIIHRTKIRKMNSTEPAYVFLYTDRVGWVNKLQSYFQLPDENRKDWTLINKGKFKASISKYIKIAHQRLQDLDKNKRYGLGKINKSLKQWFKDNWNDELKQKMIIQEFQKANIHIHIDDNGWKYLELK